MGVVKIGKKQYRTGVADILRDTKLRKAFQSFAKKTDIEEMYNFLTTNFEPKKHYPIFIKQSSPQQINIKSSVYSAMKTEADAERWDKNTWTPFVVSAKKEIRRLIEKNYLETTNDYSFWRSTEFAQLAKKHIGIPAKAAERLGIKAENIGLLKDLMIATSIKNKNLIDNYRRKLSIAQKKKFSPQEITTLMKSLS